MYSIYRHIGNVGCANDMQTGENWDGEDRQTIKQRTVSFNFPPQFMQWHCLTVILKQALWRCCCWIGMGIERTTTSSFWFFLDETPRFCGCEQTTTAHRMMYEALCPRSFWEIPEIIPRGWEKIIQFAKRGNGIYFSLIWCFYFESCPCFLMTHGDWTWRVRTVSVSLKSRFAEKERRKMNEIIISLFFGNSASHLAML